MEDISLNVKGPYCFNTNYNHQSSGSNVSGPNHYKANYSNQYNSNTGNRIGYQHKP
ncbi:hypothetical protein HAX54_006884, partial [Datura stramonium]|nr:hypothetical protein [Datura stramonium]